MSVIRVFFQTNFKARLSDAEAEALKADFIHYKKTGIPPDTFGRDAPYNHINSLPIVKEEELAHIHLEDPEHPWSVLTLQFNRVSDIHLVYCQGYYDPDCYLLMDILTPDAHEQACNNSTMYNFGKMAEKFREQY